MYKCTHCNELFENRNVLANHVRWTHKKERCNSDKFLILCSCIVCRKELSSQTINSHYTSKHTVKAHCKNCDEKIFQINKQFCSRSCAAIHNNKNKDFKTIKPGPKKGTKPANFYPYTKIKQCGICKKYHPNKGKTCSSKCKSKLLSESMKSAIARNSFDPNKNRGRGKQSYLESSFEKWLKLEFPELLFETEKPFRNNTENKTYFADFYFPDINLIIELDGTQHKLTEEYDFIRDEFIRNNYNVQIIRISHSEYVSKERVSEIRALLGNRTPPK